VGTASAFQMYVDASSAIEVIAPMELGDDSTAFFGKFVHAPDGIGSDGDGYATYDFAVPADGNYRIWGRVIAPDGSGDSFFWGIDLPGTPTSAEDCTGNTPGDEKHIWDTGQPFVEWTWSGVMSRSCQTWASGAIIPLTAGSHVLAIIQREDGAQLDGLVISDEGVTIADLPADENAAMEIATAVEPVGKVATVWGALKANR
ncbi:hypothetical protein ACFL6S_33385, partial [Candidatus Poribacteria bacterium]